MRTAARARIRPLASLAWLGMVAIVVTTLLAIALVGCQSSPSEVAVGSPAPDFTVRTLDGQRVSLSDLKGKTVVLNMWATWCGYCRLEMPEMEEAFHKYQDQGVVIVALNIQESYARVKQFIEAEGFTFPVWLDSDGSVAKTYRVSGLPMTFFIDGEGVLQRKQLGQLTGETLLDGIRVASKGSIK
ncbi:MAG: peroxiredoxin family protein [Chloroflexota bacterium]